MKKFIVYYSLEGNTRFIARLIAETLGADLLELKPKEDISSTGFSRFLNEFIGEIDFIDPARRDKEKNARKARAWAQKILQ